MTLRTITVPLFSDIDPSAPLDAALSIARLTRAHIEGVLIRPDPATGQAAIAAYGLPNAANLAEMAREGEERAAACRAAFNAWMAQNGLAGDGKPGTVFARWHDHIGWPEEAIVQHGRLADLLVMNLPVSFANPTGPAFESAVFNSGRPTLVVPSGTARALPGKVLLAWNGSLEATRAMAGAMPLLKTAKQVFVLTIPETKHAGAENMDVCAALRWHDINGVCLMPHRGSDEAGTAIQRAASELQADMVVMGAYTHGRVRQFLLGGATRHLLENSTIPILFGH